MGFVTTNQAQKNISNKFSFKNMKALMDYLSTFNCETQTVYFHTTSEENLISTGTKTVMHCGQPMRLPAETDADISACTAGTETAWATGTSYSVGDVRKNGNNDDRYVCILAHTSQDNSDSGITCNEPGESDNWEHYWEQRKHSAVNASGTTIATLSEKWFLVTAIEDGTLQIWEAGDTALVAAGAECEIPWYDPMVYIPVALAHVANNSGATITIGTTDFDATSVVTTWLQVTGPIFPHPDNWDKN
jgi:hypothetical protein